MTCEMGRARMLRAEALSEWGSLMQPGTSGSNFERVGSVEPERDSLGAIIEAGPQTNQPLHKYGRGPFCRFRIAQGHNWQRSGVYVLTVNGVAHYVGECKNLAMIWGHVGHIGTRAVEAGGQQTFCRLNTLILDEAKRGSELVLWFQAVEDAGERRALKAQLIGSRNPAWNLPVRDSSRAISPPPRRRHAPSRIEQPSQVVTRPSVAPEEAETPTRQGPGILSAIKSLLGMERPDIEESASSNDRRFGGLLFSYVGRIQPEQDARGQVIEEYPQRKFRNVKNLPLSRYGSGPFCRFRVGQGWQRSGVYALVCGTEVRYIGDAVNLERRWGYMGYGQISPRACYQGGQDTNCRINNLILQETKAGREFHLWFHPVEGQKHVRRAVEAQLMASLQPPWNR